MFSSFVALDQVRNYNLENEEIQKVELTDGKATNEQTKVPVLPKADEQELPIKDVIVPTESENVKAVGSSAIATTEGTEEKSTEQKETKVSAYDGKTKLQWPLSGNVILPYSMDSTIYFQTLDQYQCNEGMMIQAAKGAEVKSIAEGTVIKVEKDTKYGTMVIVDIGNKYTVTYGQLQDVNWKKGDLVEKDAIIGKVNQVTEFFTLEGNHLYFEMKKDKKPVDPMLYLM